MSVLGVMGQAVTEADTSRRCLRPDSSGVGAKTARMVILTTSGGSEVAPNVSNRPGCYTSVRGLRRTRTTMGSIPGVFLVCGNHVTPAGRRPAPEQRDLMPTDSHWKGCLVARRRHRSSPPEIVEHSGIGPVVAKLVSDWILVAVNPRVVLCRLGGCSRQEGLRQHGA